MIQARSTTEESAVVSTEQNYEAMRTYKQQAKTTL